MARGTSRPPATRPAQGLTWLEAPWSPALSTGALEVLKWLALLAMVADHVNTFWLKGGVLAWQAVGRLAFPLFAFVLGHNLARRDPPVVGRLLGRLVLAGLVAQPSFMLLTRGGAHLNVLFTFALAVLLVAGWRQLHSRGGRAALVALVGVGGALVEFNWYGLALVVAAYQACRRRTRGAALTMLAALLALTLWLALASGPVAWTGLAAWPVVVLLRNRALKWRRRPYAFYVFYPVHLALLAAVQPLLR